MLGGGAYRVDALLASGAMGRVYLGEQLSVGREVVVKTLKLSDTDTELNEILARRFQREAVATARLDHPNTVRLIDYGDDDGLQYLVLERLHGRSLAQVLSDEGPLPAPEVARIGVCICRSLAAAHAAGVIHRDLKPENVFLCDYPGEPRVVKVMDFGVARLLPHTDQHVSRITTAGLTVGTPMYIAPEQARGLDTTPATDLYSLGVVLFELLAGYPPFVGGSGMEIAIKHIKEAPPALPTQGLPPAHAAVWRDLVASLLAKDPAWRPASAAEVAGHLAELAHDSPLVVPEQPGSAAAPAPALALPPSPRAAPTQRLWLMAAAASVALFIGVLLGRLL
jgi:serine/threonine-protein kinase